MYPNSVVCLSCARRLNRLNAKKFGKNLLYVITIIVGIFLVTCFLLKISTRNKDVEIKSPERNRKLNSFDIDYDLKVFVKDGVPFQYISGSLHYFRVPREYWRDRLRKYRAAGLNTICTYVEWSSHEPNPSQFEFSGECDLEHFIELAIEEDLFVILRPGPYICAERDFGGLPSWLLTLYPDIKLRSSDKNYNKRTKLWFEELFRRMNKFLHGNGGPIIMVQVENEYGRNPFHDATYMEELRDMMKDLIKDKALLFTTDNNDDMYLSTGTVDGVYATVDFGTTEPMNEETFLDEKAYTRDGPLVNSEFYSGWLSHWNESLANIDSKDVIKMLKRLLEDKVNINIYMFHGGTNFGFTSGANYETFYKPQLTSYDYDAPLNESGDPTPKYFMIRELIGKLPNITLPVTAPKGKYGEVQMKPVASIFGKHAQSMNYKNPPTFEKMNQSSGYVLYETMIPFNVPSEVIPVLKVKKLHDRATVYINENRIGVLSRAQFIHLLPIHVPCAGRKLSLLVESQGRINFEKHLKDFKGILGDVTLNGVPLYQWQVTGLPMTAVNVATLIHNRAITIPKNCINPPFIYQGEMILPASQKHLDTFVDPTGWGKGVIFVNNFNLGRFWPSVGPQVTLYVPGCYLKEKNVITIFETEYVPESLKISFVDKSFLNKKIS